jgi:PiT family inorganic phosphate transporter
LLLGFGLQRLMGLVLRRARPRANVWLRRLQWVTSAALAFSHGTNDGQKSMGVITLVLGLAGYVNLTVFRVPLWVKLACAFAISFGVLSGGWRIMKTLGRGIFKLRPVHGFTSQFTSAGVILGHSLIGGPVSTTHVVTSTVMGIGTASRKKAVRWGKVREIGLAWLLTVPASAIAGAVWFFVFSPLARLL